MCVMLAIQRTKELTHRDLYSFGCQVMYDFQRSRQLWGDGDQSHIVQSTSSCPAHLNLLDELRGMGPLLLWADEGPLKVDSQDACPFLASREVGEVTIVGQNDVTPVARIPLATVDMPSSSLSKSEEKSYPYPPVDNTGSGLTMRPPRTHKSSFTMVPPRTSRQFLNCTIKEDAMDGMVRMEVVGDIPFCAHNSAHVTSLAHNLISITSALAQHQLSTAS
ncbi:hypothetical protein E2C01_009860 [Portunus trituberculatus]|uniref:Uncharacterized protein n=1 Tax=Portunus trituberculatus TaxID=210409 RepID=A0A5B7D6W6_PORTR|nr:hypothetical protein [Portunus trituberculatus]